MLSIYFHYFAFISRALHWNKLDFPLPKDTLCKDPVVPERRWKCEKFTDRCTDMRAFSSDEQKIKICRFLTSPEDITMKILCNKSWCWTTLKVVIRAWPPKHTNLEPTGLRRHLTDALEYQWTIQIQNSYEKNS